MTTEETTTIEPQPAPAAPPRRPPFEWLADWYAGLSRRWRTALWIALLGWIAAGALFLGDADGPIRGGDAGTGRTQPGEAVLLAVQGGDGAASALALVHDGATRDVVLLPAGTLAEVPGVGPVSMRETLARHGPETLSVTVANALGIRVPGALSGDRAAMATLVDALGGAQVDVPERIEVTQDGFVRTLFERGRTRMDGEKLTSFLTLQLQGENELERVARQHAAWLAVFRAVDRAPESLEDGLRPWSRVSAARAEDVLSAVAGDDKRSVLTLPVSRVGVSQEDLYKIEAAQLDPIKAALRDVTPRPATGGRRVRLLVGADGDVGPAITRQLVERGYVVVFTGRASAPYDETRVVMAERSAEGSARNLLRLVGVGRLGVATRPTSLFDVTLVVGRDWARAHRFPQPGDSNG